MKQINNIILAALLLFSLGAGAQSSVPKVKIDALEKMIAESDRPTVVNFWATFCAPCVKEIPYFQGLVKKYEKAGVRLLLVSLDMPEDYAKVGAFAKKRGFTAPVYFLDETNADLFCPRVDPKWSGAIPATLFINRATAYRSFYEEGVSKEAFEKELKKMLIKASKL
ncbi:TlpA disulfide reductase family protein [Flaviaesturariibacter flavus]|nr:TlpA disulfide reductase family protein [Flaviaesturariibacter flavus]